MANAKQRNLFQNYTGFVRIYENIRAWPTGHLPFPPPTAPSPAVTSPRTSALAASASAASSPRAPAAEASPVVDETRGKGTGAAQGSTHRTQDSCM